MEYPLKLLGEEVDLLVDHSTGSNEMYGLL